MVTIKEGPAQFCGSLRAVNDILDEATSDYEPNESIMEPRVAQPSNESADGRANTTANEDCIEVIAEVTNKLNTNDNEGLDDNLALCDACLSSNPCAIISTQRERERERETDVKGWNLLLAPPTFGKKMQFRPLGIPHSVSFFFPFFFLFFPLLPLLYDV